MSQRRAPSVEPQRSGSYFFLSYAHTPASMLDARRSGDALVARLFDDLSVRVRRALGAAPYDAVGFFDRDRAPGRAAREWVGRELAACRVLVPLYSPRYFASEACGREVSAFMQRVETSTAGVVPVAPVWWVRSERSVPRLPAPAVDLLPTGDPTGLRGDLYEVMTLRGQDEADRYYDGALSRLAERIVELGEMAAAPVADPIDLERQPNAFAAGPRPRLDLCVVAPARDRLPPRRQPDQYGDSALDWNPYPREATDGLDRHLAQLARNLQYEPVLTSFDDAGGDDATAGPAVVVVDPWALDDPAWRSRLADFDFERRPGVGVVAAWDLADPETAAAQDRLTAQLRQTVPHRFARQGIGLQLDAGVASSLVELDRALSRVVQDAAIRYLKQDADPGSAPREPDNGPTGGAV
jgi:FxsC-like protein